MTKQVWLAALTAAFIAGSMAIAHAQAGGGGGGGAAAGGDGGGGAAGSDPSQRGASTSPPSPRYKDERFEPMPGRSR